MTARAARELLIGIDGPAVEMPGRVAAYLERHAGLRDFHLKHRGRDREVDEFLVAMHFVAEKWRRSEVGTAPAAAPEPDASSSQWISTRAAANRLQMTDRGVRKAIEGGRLKAEQRDGRWWVHAEDVAHFKKRKQEE